MQSLHRALGNEDFAQKVLGGIILGGGRCRQAAETRKEWPGDSGEPASPLRPAWHWVTSKTLSSVEF